MSWDKAQKRHMDGIKIDGEQHTCIMRKMVFNIFRNSKQLLWFSFQQQQKSWPFQDGGRVDVCGWSDASSTNENNRCLFTQAHPLRLRYYVADWFLCWTEGDLIGSFVLEGRGCVYVRSCWVKRSSALKKGSLAREACDQKLIFYFLVSFSFYIPYMNYII